MKTNRLWYLLCIVLSANFCQACGDSSKSGDAEEDKCDLASKPDGDCQCVDNDHWQCKEGCDLASKPDGDCQCVDNDHWQCEEACDLSKKPEGDCYCADNDHWQCNEACDPSKKPEDGECYCDEVSKLWQCINPGECDESTMPQGDLKCQCEEGAWVCCDFTELPKDAMNCICEENNWRCDKKASLRVVPVEGFSTTIQEGDYIQYEISVDQAPKQPINVYVGIDNRDNSPLPDNMENFVSVSTDSIEITKDNWTTPSLVVVQTQRDYIENGDHTMPLHVISHSSERTFDDIEVYQDFTVLDIDKCGLVFSPSENLQTSEAGDSVEIALSLSCKPNTPNGSVKYHLSVDKETEGVITSSRDVEVRFVENPEDAVIITVRGVDDSSVDGPQKYQIVATPDSDNPPGFQETVNLSVTNMDNDASGLNVEDSIVVVEGEGTSLGVSLSVQPKADVTVTFNPNNSLTIEPGSLTFTPGDYNTVQYFSVMANDDDIINGERNVELTLVSSSADVDYERNKTVQVVVSDNDKAGIVFDPEFNSAKVNEGESICPPFHLRTKPSKDVTITAKKNGTDPISFPNASVKFTPENWNVSQCIEIKASDDGIVQTSSSHYDVKFDASSSDQNYVGTMDTKQLEVVNKNSYEIIVNNLDTSVVEGSTGKYEVRLNAKPTSDVLIYVTSWDSTAIVPKEEVITITPDKWDTFVQASFQAVNNQVVDKTRQTYLRLRASSGDKNFSGVSLNTKNITVKDDDSPSIVVTETSTARIDCSKSGASKTYKVALAKAPSQSITVNVSSSSSTHKVSPTELHFMKTSYSTPWTVTVTCSIEEDARSNVWQNEITFSPADTSVYPAPSVRKTYYYYPIGSSFKWTTPDSTGTIKKHLVPGNYAVTLCGAQGGGDRGGKGGKVSATLSLSRSTDAYIYVGGMGTRSPTTVGATNNSGGVGYRRGGKGEWGINNYGYGGGGTTEIHLESNTHRSFVAGGGGGGTVKSKDASGYGGRGGCQSDTDSNCYGTNANKSSTLHWSNKNTDGTGGDYYNDCGGGGGAGYVGGGAGAEQIGGNGGTSIINNNKKVYNYLDSSFTAGACAGNGYVTIDVL